MNIKKSIMKVFSANFIQMISSILVGFLVPKILSIEGYASLKTYTLLMSYIGLFHLGFLDGLFIKYGGKKINEIKIGELKSEHKFYIYLEFLFSILVLMIGLITKSMIIFLFGLTILPYMISAFYRYFFQATGEFDKYTKLMYIYSITYLISNVLLALVFKNDNYVFYCLSTVLTNILSGIIFELSFITKATNYTDKIEYEKIKKILKTGIFILIGNLSLSLMFGIDKWFVKIFLSTKDFAYYSFAVSLLNIINTLVNAISITFYNYLFSHNSSAKINNLKRHLLCLGALSSMAFFPLSFIVNIYLEKYVASLSIISITFAIFPYLIIINSLFVNLYKINKNEKKYLKVVLSMLLAAIIYNVIAIKLFNNTISLAAATIITTFTWYLYSSYDLNKINNRLFDYIYPIVMTASFILISNLTVWYVGLPIYTSIFAVSTYLYNPSFFKQLLNKKLLLG